MVITEALARALPVVTTGVGGTAEALGRGVDGSVPGLLVPPADPATLSDTLRRWLGDPTLRTQLRTSAAERRRTLTSWSDTSTRLARVLAAVAA